LSVAVIGAALGTLLVTAVSLAALETEGFLATTGTAIALPAVAVATQIKHRTAGRKVAETLAKEFETSQWHRFG
jgi:hypothetical protein